MHPFFEPLNDRDSMLLLTTLTVGGSDETAIFEGLPATSKAQLDEKAQALLEIPSNTRISFMVREMKQALVNSENRGLDRVDPTWIVRAMKGESARVVACLMMSLSKPTVRSVLKLLPPGIRNGLPSRDEMKSVRPEIIRAVRQIFGRRFMPMPKLAPQGFRFRDILHLDRGDLFILMRTLGLVELGQAFVSVGPMALTEFCRRLPRNKAEELIGAVRSASHTDLPDLKYAERFLAKVSVDFHDTEEFFQKSGLWRAARASLLEEDSFVLAMRQRLPKRPGTLYGEYFERAREAGDYPDDMLQRLQDSVLVRIVRLSRQGAIDRRWGGMDMSYFDHASALAALADPPRPESEQCAAPLDIEPN